MSFSTSDAQWLRISAIPGGRLSAHGQGPLKAPAVDSPEGVTRCIVSEPVVSGVMCNAACSSTANFMGPQSLSNDWTSMIALHGVCWSTSVPAGSKQEIHPIRVVGVLLTQRGGPPDRRRILRGI